MEPEPQPCCGTLPDLMPLKVNSWAPKGAESILPVASFSDRGAQGGVFPCDCLHCRLRGIPSDLEGFAKVTSLMATLKEYANKGRGVPGCVYNSTAVLLDKR